MLDEATVKDLLQCKDLLTHATVRRGSNVVLMDSLTLLSLQTFAAEFSKLENGKTVSDKIYDCCKPIKRMRPCYYFTKYELLGILLLGVNFASAVSFIMFTTVDIVHYIAIAQLIINLLADVYLVSKTKDRGLSKESDILDEKRRAAIKAIEELMEDTDV